MNANVNRDQSRLVRFLSLGGGVQSTVMLMMAINGELERPDHVLFADTGWDGDSTMDHVAWCERQCVRAGLPFHRVTAGNIRKDMMTSRSSGSGGYIKAADGVGRAGRYATMPLFVDTGKAVEGRIRRQCTSEYKIAPLRAKQRELLGYQPRQRIPPASCEVWIGISTDEARRAATSRDRWVDNVFPLIDPMKMSRADCQKWWESHYPHRSLGKSACLGCPNRSDREWSAMKRYRPGDWAQVVAFDAAIRSVTGMRGASYLHRSLRPIGEVPLGEGQDTLDLEDAVYCAGGCGL
jgi:hypothetical protein